MSDADDAATTQRCAEDALVYWDLEVAALDFVELYSCFPIAVSSVADPLGLAADDPFRRRRHHQHHVAGRRARLRVASLHHL